MCTLNVHDARVPHSDGNYVHPSVSLSYLINSLNFNFSNEPPCSNGVEQGWTEACLRLNKEAHCWVHKKRHGQRGRQRCRKEKETIPKANRVSTVCSSGAPSSEQGGGYEVSIQASQLRTKMRSCWSRDDIFATRESWKWTVNAGELSVKQSGTVSSLERKIYLFIFLVFNDMISYKTLIRHNSKRNSLSPQNLNVQYVQVHPLAACQLK